MSNLILGSPENIPDLDEKVVVKGLADTTKNPFLVVLNETDCQRVAEFLGLTALRKLRFQGDIKAFGRQDWQLKAKLGASVVQGCVVTNKPVNTRIDIPVGRVFVKSAETRSDNKEDDLEGGHEVEFDGNDEIELLEAEIDLGAILIESLALALPDYPRDQDAAFGEALFAPPGIDPIRDEDTKPFASLAALRDKLDK